MNDIYNKILSDSQKGVAQFKKQVENSSKIISQMTKDNIGGKKGADAFDEIGANIGRMMACMASRDTERANEIKDEMMAKYGKKK